MGERRGWREQRHSVGDGWAAAWGTDVGDESRYYDLQLRRFDADWAPLGEPIVVGGGQRRAMALVADDDVIEIVHGTLGGGHITRYDADSLAELEAVSVASDSCRANESGLDVPLHRGGQKGFATFGRVGGVTATIAV